MKKEERESDWYDDFKREKEARNCAEKREKRTKRRNKI